MILTLPRDPHSPSIELPFLCRRPIRMIAFVGLRIVHYSEGIEPSDDSSSDYAIARLVARNGNPGWWAGGLPTLTRGSDPHSTGLPYCSWRLIRDAISIARDAPRVATRVAVVQATG